MPDPNDSRPGTPRDVHLGPSHNGGGWWKWLLLALALIALLLLLMRSCSHRDTAAAVAPVDTNQTDAAQTDATAGGTAVAATATAPSSQQLGTFLAGSEATPRTFTLDKPNFDTGQSVIRDADKPAITELAGILQKYPSAKVKLVGYADARGPDPVNVKLGQARADAVKAALTGAGIDAGRIATASGGANDPVDSNATANGRFENRRTEIVVTSR